MALRLLKAQLRHSNIKESVSSAGSSLNLLRDRSVKEKIQA